MAIVGYTLLGILAVLLLLLCTPAFITVRYCTDEPPYARLRWLLLNLDLLDTEKDKPAKKPKKDGSEKPQKKQTAKKQPMEFTELLGLATDLISSLGGGAGLVVRRFRLYLVKVHFVVAEDDAAETAIAYGRVNTVIYTIYATAGQFLNMAPPDIQVRPDFTAQTGSVDFELRGRLLPIVALAAGLRIGCSFLVKVLKRRSADKDTNGAPPQKKTDDI